MDIFDPLSLLAQVTSTTVQAGEAEPALVNWVDFRTELVGALVSALILAICAWQWPRLKGWLYATGTSVKEQFIDVPAQPLPDKINFVGLTTNPEDLLAKYNERWLDLYDNPTASDSEHAEDAIPLNHRRRIRGLRLDTYLWPELAWRQAIPTSQRAANAPVDGDQNDNLDDSWRTPDGDDAAAVNTLLGQLKRDRLMVLYDRAGMGKTAFTHKLCHLLLSAQHRNVPLASLTQPDQRLLVVRLEGVWPRDAHGAPLGLLDVLADEVLGLRIGGEKMATPIVAGDGEAALGEKRQVLMQTLPQWLRAGRVFVILDAFDQMPDDDRKAAVDQIKLARATSGSDRCHWLVTGRHYALRPYVGNHSLVTNDLYRFRLRPFTPAKQDAYFEDLERRLKKRGFTFAEKSRLLDQVCPDRQSMSSDLGIPWHLSMIRSLIEANLSDHKVATPSPLPQIENTARLHLMVSDETLERVIERAAIDFGAGGIDAKVRMLRRVCGVLAWQMMLDENYNALIHVGTNLPAYRGVHADELVASYLDRCRARYLANRGHANAPAAEKDWTEAIELLKRIEVTDFSDLDVFKAECRAFRSRKTMEWYAAHFLMNHATEHDLTRPCPDAGAKSGMNFVGNENWDGCWKLAIDLPDNAVTHSFVASALGILFGQPGPGQRRPAELMYAAWERWLEPKKGQPLADAKPIIAKYRQQLDQIAAETAKKGQIVARLRFDAKRDRPDESRDNPNKTENVWYRRIPPEGDSTTFEREHQRVTVGMFWMRKFLITNDEYRLFDPNRPHPSGHKFDGPDQPVIEVEWYMAVMFARWLGPGYRLPTEAEWEAACRAGTQTAFWFGDNEDELSKHAWFKKNSDGRTHGFNESQVAGGHENPWGLFDMHGNVWEWCQDWYADYESQQEVTNPIGPDAGSYRVARGGSWDYQASRCRAATRGRGVPSYRDSFLGFRLLLSPLEGSPEARG
jgi:formylglycine-generating enzyme required for sulfatase activity